MAILLNLLNLVKSISIFVKGVSFYVYSYVRCDELAPGVWLSAYVQIGVRCNVFLLATVMSWPLAYGELATQTVWLSAYVQIGVRCNVLLLATVTSWPLAYGFRSAYRSAFGPVSLLYCHELAPGVGRPSLFGLFMIAHVFSCAHFISSFVY